MQARINRHGKPTITIANGVSEVGAGASNPSQLTRVPPNVASSGTLHAT